MAEWHITPDYIVNNWTEELLNLMIDKLTERKERERSPKPPEENDANLARMGNMVKVVKHGN